MKSANYVSEQIPKLKKSGIPLWQVVWKVALLCVGWAYVFGARGELCSPSNRRSYYKSKGASHPTIKSKCKGFESGDCSGCKWYPSCERTRFFDCRGFTYWVLYVVYGWKLQGTGATSQWNNAKNWKCKGTIDTMPKDVVVCLFQYNKAKKNMAHTGFGYGNETIECQVGVQHKKSLDSKFTHWAIPACFDANYVPPVEKPKEEKKPVKKTIRKGSKGALVTECQTMLKKLGYSLGICGVDGDFGIATENAVKAFQKDFNLKVDGIVGEKTWDALQKAVDKNSTIVYYNVVIKHLTASQADEVLKLYNNAYKEAESK